LKQGSPAQLAFAVVSLHWLQSPELKRSWVAARLVR